MNKKFNFMDSIYGVLDSKEDDYVDDVLFVDDPEDDFMFGMNDDMDWANDVTIVGEFEEDEFDLDLGEGYIPLPKGNYEEPTLIVIDEDYILDEYEMDLVGNISYSEEYSVDDKQKYYDEPLVNIEEAKSIVGFKDEKDPIEEVTRIDMNSEDEKIATAIAKEYMENLTNDPLLNEEFSDPSDDTSWVDDPDLFGNDISVIIADDPDSEFVEDDYEEGSFEDWLNQNPVNETY